MTRLIPVLLLFLFLPVQMLSAEEIYFVHSLRTKVYEKPSLTSKVIGEAVQGMSYRGILKQGNWIKITFANADGFISAFAVRTSPPQQKAGVIYSADRQTQPGARARASATQTIVAGVKGLTYENRSRASKAEGVNFDDLELMESVQISPEELEQFVPGGAP